MSQDTSADEKASILLVDDRQANLTALHAILEPLGERLVCAESGTEALRQLLLREFALVLLDVQMPGIDGFQVATLIRQRPATAHLPIIFLTAVSREASQIFEGYEHGAVDYLVKPFDPYILRAKVSVFVDLWKKGRLIEKQSALLRQREREALERSSEHRFRSVTESIAACIWAADQEGRFFYANRCARAVAETIDFTQAVDAPDRDRVVERWGAAIADGRPFELECALGRRAHLVRGVIQYGEDAAPAGWIVSGVDIEELKQANRAKDAFLAIVSHELRAPLSVVLAQTEPALLGRRSQENDFPDKVFEMIRRQTRRMSRLVGDLIDIARIQAGQLSIEREEFDLSELAAEVIERVRATAPQHALQLSVAGPIRMSADPGRIDQVLTNLVSNAVRYSPDGGAIEVSCELEDRCVHLRVVDRGIGIPPDKLATIFDAFERAHGAAYGGLGLGLNIAQGIVEQHGGRIWAVSSGTPGEGSEFHVRLPLGIADAVAVA
ncbi:MAG TPA: ATP-binding protein [Kofleriaceae bacterium]|nr:ATP-binding protein [Kofleriaceae bacterium]